MTTGIPRQGEKIGIYGAGGIGKTTLATYLAEVGKKTLFVDIGDSTSHMDVERVAPAPLSYLEVRDVLHDDELIAPYDAIVLDDMTTAEEFAVEHVLVTRKTEGGQKADGAESYGWGKGYVFIYESSLLYLVDFDRIARMGKDMIVICHSATETVKNPDGTDYPQYQPRLRSNKNAKFRERFLEWCHHLLFLQMDTFVGKGGKAEGMTRSIHVDPTNTHWAKSRSISGPIPYPVSGSYSEVWKMIFGAKS